MEASALCEEYSYEILKCSSPKGMSFNPVLQLLLTSFCVSVCCISLTLIWLHFHSLTIELSLGGSWNWLLNAPLALIIKRKVGWWWQLSFSSSLAEGCACVRWDKVHTV